MFCSVSVFVLLCCLFSAFSYKGDKNASFSISVTFACFMSTFYLFRYRSAVLHFKRKQQVSLNRDHLNTFRSISTYPALLIYQWIKQSSINFKTVSLNVRGLNNSIKRRKIFRWLHRQNAHCFFLQETYSTEQSIDIWQLEWGGNIFYSHGTNHSKGVMILVNPGFQFEVVKSTKDKNGR